jgi:MYXO-CTERM domain-containing protein
LFGDVPGCTGTLIAPDLVLTAGHCIGGVSRVKLGEVDLTSPAGEEIVVAREVEHPDSFSTYDVGLLILEEPSSYTPRVVATGCVLERYAVNGAEVEIVGWGAIDQEGSQETDVLMEARSSITDIDCTGGRGCNTAVVPAGELGAGGNSVDSCFGDSGGPLYLLTDIGEYLIGITSRGYDDATRPCGEGGIYVRADAVIDWVEAESGQSLPRANCNAPPVPTVQLAQLEVEAGKSVSTRVTANDPDSADGHSYSVEAEPMHGRVGTNDDGTVTYAADDDFEGMDSFSVRVADDGIPSLSGVVELEVTVLPSEGCGCRSSRSGAGGAAAIAIAALLALVPGRRRRR